MSFSSRFLVTAVLWRNALFATVVVVFALLTAPAAWSQKTFSQWFQDVASSAADGKYVTGDPPQIQTANPEISALQAAANAEGMSDSEIQAVLDKINALSQEALQNGRSADTQAQGQSGTLLMDLGVVYPGFPYESLFPVHNGCRVEQEATIVYPNPMPLHGQTIVPVPPYSTRKVLMTLQYPREPLNAYPKAFCEIKVGQLTSVHPGFTSHNYTCDSAKREYDIVVALCHGFGADGGGGGKPKPTPQKPGPPTPDLLSASPCERFWQTGIFTPSQDVKIPSYCLDYFRQMAHKLFDRFLQENRAASPHAWAWVPTGAAIDSLSLLQIMTLRQQIVADLLKSIG